MPTDHMVSLLIAERDKLNAAIAALSGPTKRLGRPPTKPMASATAAAPAPMAPTPAERRKRRFSAAQRKQQAERMKAYWAAKKKAAAPKAK